MKTKLSPGWLQHQPHHCVTEGASELVLDVSHQVTPGQRVISSLDLLSLSHVVGDKKLNKKLGVRVNPLQCLQ